MGDQGTCTAGLYDFLRVGTSALRCAGSSIFPHFFLPAYIPSLSRVTTDVEMCDGQLVRGEAVHIPDGWNRQAGMASVAAASWHPG